MSDQCIAEDESISHREQTVIKSVQEATLPRKRPSTEVTSPSLHLPADEAKSLTCDQSHSSNGHFQTPRYEVPGAKSVQAPVAVGGQNVTKFTRIGQPNMNKKLIFENAGNQPATTKAKSPATRQSLLMSNWAVLVEGLSVNPLADVMLSKSIISYGDYAEINSKHLSRRTAVQMLLDLVRKRGEQGIILLQEALRAPFVNYDIYADLLEPKPPTGDRGNS